MIAAKRLARLFLPCFAVVAAPGLARAEDAMDACIKASERAVTQGKAGQLLEERTSLSACSAAACPEVVRTSCQQRLADVTRTIPAIVLVVKDGAGRDLAGVKLTVDGRAWTGPFDATPIELDPGAHEFKLEVEGQAPVTQRFVLHPGEHERRETIVIGPAPAGQPGPDGSPAAGAPPGAEGAGSQGDGSAQRTIGLVVGGVGVAGLLAGGIFGALSIAAHDSYEQSCGSHVGAPANQCNAAGVSGENDAATKGTISTVAFIGGGAALAVGAALFFLAPRSAAAGTQVAVGPGSLLLRARF